MGLTLVLALVFAFIFLLYLLLGGGGGGGNVVANVILHLKRKKSCARSPLSPPSVNQRSGEKIDFVVCFFVVIFFLNWFS